MSRRTAAFFDLDKTIIAKSSSLAFTEPLRAGGILSRRTMLRAAYAQFVFSVGGADHDKMEQMRLFVSQLVKGWDVASVRDIVEVTLDRIVTPLVYDEALELIVKHKEAGDIIVIVSASGSEVVEPIGAMLGADQVIASQMKVENGVYTGEISYYAYGEEKARAIRELAEQRGWDLAECYAYSDSITDAPMLREVGHPSVVNPDKELRRLATAEGWPILRFTRSVALKRKLVPPPRATIATVVVGGAAASVIYAVQAARRHRAGA